MNRNIVLRLRQPRRLFVPARAVSTSSESIANEEKSKETKDEDELELPALLKKPKRKRLKSIDPDKPNLDLSDWSRRFQNNPYAHILCRPIRQCAVTSARLPHHLLVRFAAFKVPENLEHLIVESAPTEKIKRKRHKPKISKHIDPNNQLVILPLEQGSLHIGSTSYHSLNREFLNITERSGRYHSLREAIKSSLPENRNGTFVYQNDMATVVERRLRMRIELALDRLVLSDGVFADAAAAVEKYGIIDAAISWKPTGDAIRATQFFLAPDGKTPVVRYFVNNLCGYDLAAKMQKLLFQRLSPEAGTPDLDEVAIVSTPATRELLKQLWLLRLYLKDRT
ncbi:hypothetical protein BZA70DRAFT_292938 [Myxozyma melibiosi]|uniref:Required for respiratory growth protein 8, mitochondrial n=1 Tax=Myxozyma melibiosi TaxID=54550 RepID=A0ABR1FCL4_9ASCO